VKEIGETVRKNSKRPETADAGIVIIFTAVASYYNINHL
jgi:hypothetical protein